MTLTSHGLQLPHRKLRSACEEHQRAVDDVVRLSPGYDLLSTLPYTFLDRHMALKLQGKDDNLRRGDFVDFGKMYGISERATLTMLATLCDHAEPWIGRVGEIGFDHKTTEALQREMTKRISHLRR